MANELKRQTYYIKGMHCASCELVIEKKLLEFSGVEFADASLARGEVSFDYHGDKPGAGKLNQLFKASGYIFSDHPNNRTKTSSGGLSSILITAGAIIAGFLLLEKLGLASFINLTGESAWPAFLIFGVIAGLSTCAALVGGLILSLTKQWQEHYGSSSRAAWEPNLLFNFGRIISYGLLGLILGFVGQKLQLSPFINSILIVAVSVLMTLLALQMLGVRSLSRFQLALPKSLTRRIAGGSAGQNKLAPFTFGFLTFLLPCGFTLMVEGLAVLSGNPWRGAVILGAFALGTALPLLAIGFSSAKLLSSEARADKFLRVAGILVLFFVLYNLNIQFGFMNRNNLNDGQSTRSWDDIVNNVITSTDSPADTPDPNAQVVKTVYTLRDDIIPSTFTVKKGRPVSFQVDVRDDGQGCMSTIMVIGLYNKPIYLRAGKIITMNFTPTEVGDYQIACAMGVPRGVIKVVE